MSTVEPAGTWQYAQTVWRAGRIEHALLRDQHVRPLRVISARDLGLSRRDVSHGSADVHGTRLVQLLGCPRDRTVDREIELVCGRSVPEAAQPAPIPIGQAIAREARHLARVQVEQRDPRARQLAERDHRPAGLDATAEGGQVRRHRLDEARRATARDRPAFRMTAHREHQPERGRERP
jgi:hypothetical protein